MEFRLVAARRQEIPVPPLMPPPLGLELRSAKLRHVEVAWYQPLAVYSGVAFEAGADYLALFIGEPVDEPLFRKRIRELLHRPGVLESTMVPWVQSRCSFRGVSTAVFVDATGSCIIESDELGVRPVYRHNSNGRLVVSSSLRAMQLTVNCSLDVAGAIQQTKLGYCLGSRTRLEGVSRNLPREVVTYDSEREELNTFVRPLTKTGEAGGLELLADRFRQTFQESIRLRIRNDVQDISFLSGGLDSRMIVSSLVEEGRAPRTYCLTHRASLDAVLARAFADAHELPFFDVPFKPAARILWAGRLRKALDTTTEEKRPPSVESAWSGDGGSVAVGGVYLTEPLVLAMSTSSIAKLTDELMAHFHLSSLSKILSRFARERILEQLRCDLSQELTRIRGEVERDYSITFFLENDQRRHLDLHFEYAAQHQIAFHLPFFDADVLRVLRSVPETELMFHRFYTRWLTRLPARTTALPWQTYSGHEPCPIPLPRSGDYQWGIASRRSFESSSRIARRNVLLGWVRSGAPSFGVISRAKAALLGLCAITPPYIGRHSVECLTEFVDPYGFGGLDLDS